MKKRFITLYESWLKRSNHGGFLVGDIVKFVDGALKNPFFKTQPDTVVQNIKSIIDSGYTLRVTNVVNKYPTVMGAGNPDDTGPEFTVEVSADTGGGRLGDSAIVPAALLTKIDTVPNLEPVPDKNKRKDKINIKPVEVKDEAEEVPFYSPARTRTSDIGGGKQGAGDRTLKNANISIPSSPAVNHKDPASYTAAYLP